MATHLDRVHLPLFQLAVDDLPALGRIDGDVVGVAVGRGEDNPVADDGVLAGVPVLAPLTGDRGSPGRAEERSAEGQTRDGRVGRRLVACLCREHCRDGIL